MEKKTYGVGIIGAGLRGAVVLGSRMVDLSGSCEMRVGALCDKLRARMDEMKFLLVYNPKFIKCSNGRKSNCYLRTEK